MSKNFLKPPRASDFQRRGSQSSLGTPEAAGGAEGAARRSPESGGSSSDPPMSPEVTEGALEVWRGLPEIIRDDPSLASFREQHLKLRGPIDEGGATDEADSNDEELDDADDADHPGAAAHGSRNPHDKSTIQAAEAAAAAAAAASAAGTASAAAPGAANGGYAKAQPVLVTITNELGQSKPLESDPRSNPAAEAHGHKPAGEAHHAQHSAWFTNTKITLLVLVWLAFTLVLMNKSEKVLEFRQMAVSVNETRNFVLPNTPINPRIGVHLRTAFADSPFSNSTNFLHVYVQLLYAQRPINDTANLNHTDIEYTENITSPIILQLATSDQLERAAESKRYITFDIGQQAYDKVHSSHAVLRIRMRTVMAADDEAVLPLQFAYDDSPIDQAVGVVCAALVLFGLYVMIIWEVVHRTFAAIFASTVSIAILAALNVRPTMPEIVSWIDVETLLLLFGMMILVAILSETGIFDYLAVYAYKITSGRVWPLINCLCLFTAILSSFLDNVTTVLLMTPVSIRLCEVMGLNPVPILMAMIIYSNVGGAMTPVGDPPNVIIASNGYISSHGVTFLNFSVHMSVGILFVLIQTYFQLRYHQFRDINTLRFREPQNIQALRHEIAVWQRAASSLSSYSKDEDVVRESLLKKVKRLNKQLKKRIASGSVPVESYRATLEELQAKYPIRNKNLLIKSGVVLVFVISFFFLHSMPHIQRLSLGWTALLGAVLLLILADRDDMEAVLSRVEWSTLLFFAALFILMESLSLLGLIDWIGKQTEALIMSVSEESRLAVAILIILWVSAIASAFVDNIPLTTMMVKITISLAENEALGLPLQPLVWALAFGACLGGNGTLIGASANVVCAGVAEQHGYRFTFVEYFKVGFPLMLGSIVVTTGYLMVSHVLFEWH